MWQDGFDAATNDAISAAFQSGADGFHYEARGWKYELDFSSMIQKNLTTKRERQLRKIERGDVPPPALIPSVVAMTTAHPPKSSTRVGKKMLRAKVDAKGGVLSKDSSKVDKGTAVMDSSRIACTGTVLKDSSKVDGKDISKADERILPLKSKSGGKLFDGVVKSFLKDKGYGFISLPDGTEVFFHVTVLVGDTIHVGDTVKCALAAGGSRKSRASEVHVAKRGALMRMICRNPICQSRRDRHFEDKCPNSQE